MSHLKIYPSVKSADVGRIITTKFKTTKKEKKLLGTTEEDFFCPLFYHNSL